MNILLQGPMQDQLNNIDDNSVDLLLTDPPYNISEKGAKPKWFKEIDGKKVDVTNIHSQRFDETFDEQWDSVTHEKFVEQLHQWACAWYPKIRKGGSFAIFISDQYISYLWKAMEAAGFEPKRVWTWKKPAAVPFNRSVNPVSGAEYIVFGIKPKGKRTFNADAEKGSIVERYAMADKISSILYKHIKDDPSGNIEECFEQALKEAKTKIKSLKTTGNIRHCVVPNTISFSGGSGKKIHPTQKPQEILEYFISLCTNPGDTVLDTFAGSGSTGLAAIALDRKYVLIERDAKMFAKMKAQFDKSKKIDPAGVFSVDV